MMLGQEKGRKAMGSACIPVCPTRHPWQGSVFQAPGKGAGPCTSLCREQPSCQSSSASKDGPTAKT